MNNRLTVIILQDPDPYLALAIEEWYLDHPNGPLLLLWRSPSAVVIGRNQNPWLECDPADMRRSNVRLVRRLSGGGAVYHDNGNLNIAFIDRRAHFDADSNLMLVQEALLRLGITAVRTPRRDLTIENKKVSGSAFWYRQTHILHHATLLIESDLTRLRRHLRPALPTIESRAIRSVGSSVTNLADSAPGLTVERTIAALADIASHGAASSFSLSVGQPDMQAAIMARANQLRSWEWLYGRTPPFRLDLRRDFDWGKALARIQINRAAIEAVQLEIPSPLASIARRIETTLVGRRLSESIDHIDRETDATEHSPTAEISAWIMGTFY